jgi:myo-inositol-1(or 4)-monophosphatase
MSVQELTTSDFPTILQFSILVARKAGSLILQGSEAITSIEGKANSVDLVTEYDVKVEELVKSEFKAKYPDFGFIGEESYSAGTRPALTDAPTFCVDPIDGTTNFIHGFPFVCISIGLLYKRRPVLGVIYNPFLDHLYYGFKGGGSYLIKSGALPLKLPLSLSVKPLPSLHDALIAVEWGSDRSRETIATKSSSFSRLAGDPDKDVEGGKMVHSLRSVGSAALNFSLVAQGALDIYWEIGCWPWDVCAGIVIAEEAGGVVTGSRDAFLESCKNGSFGDVTEAILTGRKYIVIRGIADTPNESGREAQQRLIRDFYQTVEEAEPN